jgi:hypothetical protein
MTRTPSLRALCMIGLWALAAQEAAAQEAVEAAAASPPAWALGVSVGMPYAPALSLTWRPIQSLYFGPTIANLFGLSIRSPNSSQPSQRQRSEAIFGLEVGGVVGGEWARWGTHGLMAEVNGGYMWRYSYASDAINLPTVTPGAGGIVGAQVGWFARPDQTTWQVTVGITYLFWVLEDSSKQVRGPDSEWLPTLKLTARFGL